MVKSGLDDCDYIRYRIKSVFPNHDAHNTVRNPIHCAMSQGCQASSLSGHFYTARSFTSMISDMFLWPLCLDTAVQLLDYPLFLWYTCYLNSMLRQCSSLPFDFDEENYLLL